MIIWKKRYRPFIMGGCCCTTIKTEIPDMPVVDLGKGFTGIFIESEGVFETESGGFIGDTIQMVKEDIEDCNDVQLMKDKIQEAKAEREKADMVSNEVFFGKIK